MVNSIIPWKRNSVLPPVQGEEQESDDIIPEAYEPVEVNDHGEVNLLQIFEDELLLSLPIVPPSCRVGVYSEAGRYVVWKD